MEEVGTRAVSGAMLSVKKLMNCKMKEDFGVSNKALARGVMRKIAEWKDKGVPSI